MLADDGNAYVLDERVVSRVRLDSVLRIRSRHTGG